jgi:hypothetical protein
MLVPFMPTSLQTTLAAEAYLTGRELLLEQQTLNTKKSLIYLGESQKLTVSRQEGQKLEPR